MNNQNVIDLGTYEVDTKDPRIEYMLRKWIISIKNEDFTYKPFKKVEGFQ